jgi:SAM-dependent methyltransferase
MNRALFRRALPWWVRVGAKIVLARLPVPYMIWKRLGLFEHGDMNQPQRAYDTLIEHARSAGVVGNSEFSADFVATGNAFNVLEIGPGDSLFTTVIAKALGATRTWLIDAGAFASTDMPAYLGLINYLRQKGFQVGIGNPNTLAEVLRDSNGEYLVDGVNSLSHVPSASIDFCFSNAVLEHISKADFAILVNELVRVMKPSGVSVHRVDLKDHLGGGLNNLRFSEATWESSFFRNSGFYTNRIRFGEMVNIFEQAGFSYSLPKVLRWEYLPVPRATLDAAFCKLPDDDLLVSGFDIVLKLKSESA